MAPAEVQAWTLIGVGIVLGILAIVLSHALPKRKTMVMAPGKLGEALETLRAPIHLPDGRVVRFKVNAVFEKQRRAA